MDNTIEIDIIRNEALRKVGRNVVNFQKMEAMLKTLIVHSNALGPITEVEKLQKKKKKSTDRKSMGRLVEQFISLNLPDESDCSDIPENVTEAWVSFSFTFGSIGEDIRNKRNELSFLVSERNNLIHKMLSKFNPDSVESCRKLISDLDIQNEKISPQYKNLQLLLKSLSEAKKEVAKYMMSDQYLIDSGIKVDDV